MLDDAVLMRRAVRQVLDENQIDPDLYNRFTPDLQQRFQELSMAVAEDMQFNQLKYFRPFEHQKKFFLTGNSQRRGILAANRIGKTVSTCYETAMHLTGLYPGWWRGHRFDHSIVAFVAGEGWEQVARVLQEELLGTRDIKIRSQLGSGAIPRQCIVEDTMRCDGANVLGMEIKHCRGSKSYLLFGNYTQEVRQMQGFKINLAVFDEQPPDDFFSEIVTRTATTQGMVLCSFTPLKGLNGLVSKFWNREDGYEHIRVSWDDVPEQDPWGEPFLLQETRQQLERDYLPHERDARKHGIPVMGKGAVFQLRNWPTYRTGEVDFRTLPDIHRVISLDLGLVRDRTVISLMYYRPLDQQMWLHSQIVVKGVDEANPLNYINHLIRPEVFGCPIVLPADAATPGRYTMSSQSIRTLFAEYELNVIEEPIRNPEDDQGRTTNHKSFGVNIMRQMLELGTLQINENCTDFLREAQNYFVDSKGRFSDPDDCIDSCRYAVLACIQGLAEPYDYKTPQQRIAELRQRVYRPRTDQHKPKWKQTHNPEL